MKTFEYTWYDDIYLLHIQLDHADNAKYRIRVLRRFEGKVEKEELIDVPEKMTSHRFMISRCHPKEESFRIEYPDMVTLEAFKLDDRAYFPDESFFKG